MPAYDFHIPGLPVPKGSTRSFAHRGSNKIITRASNAERLEPWEGRIAVAARAAGVTVHEGPVFVVVEFIFPRPKSHFGKRGLRGSAPVHHTQRPDTDKLLRAVLDGLTGVAFADDCLVVDTLARKRWAGPNEQPGAAITVTMGEG